MFIDLESLAYLTAATHGLSEEAESLAESLNTHLDKVMYSTHACMHVRTACMSIYNVYVYMHVQCGVQYKTIKCHHIVQ